MDVVESEADSCTARNAREVSAALIEELTVAATITPDTLRAAILHDWPSRSLPFGLVQSVLSRLRDNDAHVLLEAASSLGVWREYEYALLRFHQVRLRGGPDWPAAAIPHVRQVFAATRSDSALHWWATCWLAEHCPSDFDATLAAFVGFSASVTHPGYYLHRLRLWLEHPSEVDAVLPNAVTHLSDGWTVLGRDRLVDRLAITVLLARALQLCAAGGVEALSGEVTALCTIIPDALVRKDLLAGLEMLADAPSFPGSFGESEIPEASEEQLRLLLSNARATEALRFARESPVPSASDARVRWALLTADAASRADSTSAALATLDAVAPLVRSARPLTAWAFHMVSNGIHHLRADYAGALREIEFARSRAGELADHQKLYHTTLVRKWNATQLQLPNIERECQGVLDVLNLLREQNGEVPYDPRDFSVAKWLKTEAAVYRATLLRLRDVRHWWATTERNDPYRHQGPDRDRLIAELYEKISDVASQLPSEADEPLLVARFRAEQSMLMLYAGRWRQVDAQLYQGTIKPAVDHALTLATKLENYYLLDYLVSRIEYHRDQGLRTYVPPVAIPTLPSAERDTLTTMCQQVRTAARWEERREVLDLAQRIFKGYLGRSYSQKLDQSEVLDLLSILQDLKQPALEYGIGPPPVPASADAEFGWNEDFQLRKAMPPPPPNWAQTVGERLSRENAICLDLFTYREQAFCFLIEGSDGHLFGRILPLWLRGRDRSAGLRYWRSRFRKIAGYFASNVDPLFLKQAAVRISESLGLHGHLFPKPLEGVLRDYRPSVVYVAPTFDLNSLPLHALGGPRGFNLSSIGPVLQIAKAQHLSEHQTQPDVSSVSVLAGPEDVFQSLGLELARRLGGEFADPQTRPELVATLHRSTIAILLGHGGFDHRQPERSRVSLNHGLRLMIRDIEELELQGTEVVLLGCWTGMGVRSHPPGAVLAPLWPIPIEAGAEFIADFVSARKHGLSRAQAIEHTRKRSHRYPFGALCSTAYILWGTES